MLRRFTWALVLVAMLAQAFGLATQAAAGAAAQDLVHALLHLSDEPHHHGDDGAVHTDGSQQSQVHVSIDGATAAPVLLPAQLATPSIEARSTPPRLDVSIPPPPFLDALRRPPRLAA